MPQLNAGEIFTDVDPGDIVTSTRLNNHVNGGTLLNGAVIDQQQKSPIVAGDFFLLGDSTLADTGLPKKVVATDILVEALRNGTQQWGGVNAGTANAIAITLTPAPTAYAAGMVVRFQTGAAANTGAVTLNVNGLGAVALYNPAGTNLAAGDLPANMLVSAVCNGSQFQVASVVAAKAIGTYQETEGARADAACFDGAATFSANAYTLAPLDSSGAAAFTALQDGMLVRFRVPTGGANTGASTLTLNGLTVHPLVNAGGNALVGGELQAGLLYLALYDATNTRWLLLGSPRKFVSSLAALPATTGVVANVAHGLGATPSKVRWVLVCQTGNAGYSIGDEISVDSCDRNQGGVFGTGASSTNVWLLKRAAVASVPNKSTGVADTTWTEADWQAKCYVEL